MVHTFISLSLASSCIQFDFTPPPQHSYPHIQTSTRLSLSIYKGIRLYLDVHVRNKAEENRSLTPLMVNPGCCGLLPVLCSSLSLLVMSPHVVAFSLLFMDINYAVSQASSHACISFVGAE